MFIVFTSIMLNRMGGSLSGKRFCQGQEMSFITHHHVWLHPASSSRVLNLTCDAGKVKQRSICLTELMMSSHECSDGGEVPNRALCTPSPNPKPTYVHKYTETRVRKWKSDMFRTTLGLAAAAAAPEPAAKSNRALLCLHSHTLHHLLRLGLSHSQHYLYICVPRQRSGSPQDTRRWSFPRCWSRFQTCRSRAAGSTRQYLERHQPLHRTPIRICSIIILSCCSSSAPKLKTH